MPFAPKIGRRFNHGKMGVEMENIDRPPVLERAGAAIGTTIALSGQDRAAPDGFALARKNANDWARRIDGDDP